MLWYAVLRDSDDNDWGYGSHVLEEAAAMARQYGESGKIAVIEEGPDPVCLRVIDTKEVLWCFAT